MAEAQAERCGLWHLALAGLACRTRGPSIEAGDDAILSPSGRSVHSSPIMVVGAMQDSAMDDFPQCIACSGASRPSLREGPRDIVHKDCYGWMTYYSCCGACIRLSWKDATKLEGVCQSWDDVDQKCKEWGDRLLWEVAKCMRVPVLEVSWVWQ